MAAGPVPQAVWRWQIAAYLFLAGVGAGAFIVGVVSAHLGHMAAAQIAMTFGVPVVAVSTLFLIADLGTPAKFLTAIRHPRSSWISRGVVILSGLIVCGGLLVVFSVWPFGGVLQFGDGMYKLLEALGFVFAVATCTYTGILIGVVISRPFWNNPLLPILFLISAISTGIGGVFFVAPIASSLLRLPPANTEFLAAADMVLLITEAIAVYLYLAIVADRAPESVALLLRGKLSGLFWGGFLAAGLAVPLVIEYAVAGTRGSSQAATLIAGVLLLVGGFLMRLLILAAGIRTPLVVRTAFRVRPGT
jgi:formate-dependent nitrite reductase membrane component NrfD